MTEDEAVVVYMTMESRRLNRERDIDIYQNLARLQANHFRAKYGISKTRCYQIRQRIEWELRRIIGLAESGVKFDLRQKPTMTEEHDEKAAALYVAYGPGSVDSRKRNLQIYRDVKTGRTPDDVADENRICLGRVEQIIRLLDRTLPTAHDTYSVNVLRPRIEAKIRAVRLLLDEMRAIAPPYEDGSDWPVSIQIASDIEKLASDFERGAEVLMLNFNGGGA